MNLRQFFVLGTCAALAVPSPGFAGWTCGIDASLLPQVYALDVIDGRMEAYVGPSRRTTDSRTAFGNALVLGDNGDWTIRNDAELKRRHDSINAESCMNPPADEEWRRINKERLLRSPDFEQRIGICANGPGKRWGGISFYGGEGSWGVGGIVEQNSTTGTTRYYRPPPLVHYSTSHLEYFGDRLWIGTASYGECGTGVGVGVLSAYFANDTLYADRAMDSCGFLVSDMVAHAGSLWISTEMGLSKVSKSNDRYKPFQWTNYVPTGDNQNPMREVSCDELYDELFQSAALASAPPNDSGHPYELLWHRISKLRPNYAWQYVRRLNGVAPLADGEQSE